jgi:hypothetical protein
MLKKTAIIISSLLVLLVFTAIIYSATRPKPFSWYPFYSNYSKQPYGASVFFEQLDNFFPDKKVRKVKDYDFSPYYYDELYDIDSIDENGDYFSLTDSTAYLTYLDEAIAKFNFIGLNYSFYIDNLDAKALLLHLYQGNHALIASQDISYLLLKMLGVSMDFIDLDSATNTESGRRYTITYKNEEKIEFKAYESISRFVSYPDSAQILITNDHEDVLGINIPLGKGSITLVSVPILFTNYYLLKNDHSLVEKLVMALPLEETLWADVVEGERVYEEKRSIMSFIHSQASLTWAFYTLIIGVLVYLVFQLRRSERAVPVMDKPKNISLNFIESVSALFFRHKDNRELVRKKMTYFLDQVRVQYHIDTQQIDNNFLNLLAKKSQVKPTLLAHIFNLYKEYQKKPVVTDDEFLRFNKLMQTFKNKT